MTASPATIGTGGSALVEQCQVCGRSDFESICFLGYLPPVNDAAKIGSRPTEQPAYPAELIRCTHCELVQLSLVVDPQLLFPKEYPYTSGTTRILRENFAELYTEASRLLALDADDLIVDIGSNDGTLLSNFAANHRVQGITPEDVGELARARGIPTIQAYFGRAAAEQVVASVGPATVVTATNVFAHIENVHDVLASITSMLRDDGVFISESHYLGTLVESVQYDTIYHEHLRYYSLASIQYLLNEHGLEIFHAKEIPTHGGSIRVYAAPRGQREVSTSVARLSDRESQLLGGADVWEKFKRDIVLSKLALHHLLYDILRSGRRVYGIAAPSRASTLINYVGLDDGIIESVLEVPGSHKIGNYVPGTMIPIEDEARLFSDPPDFALMFAWHIAEELAPKLKANGFNGDFIIPLPEPRILRSQDVV